MLPQASAISASHKWPYLDNPNRDDTHWILISYFCVCMWWWPLWPALVDFGQYGVSFLFTIFACLVCTEAHSSATHAFWWHETNFFLCLTTSALTHDVLQWVSFHPIPIAICCALPSVQRGITDTFCVCKNKKTGPANVFDYPQGVSFLSHFVLLLI